MPASRSHWSTDAEMSSTCPKGRRLLPVTYYVATLFVRNEEGELVCGEAQDCQSAFAAESLARKLAVTSAGAVAFSRTGKPATGDFADAVVIRTFGEVPSMEELLSAK